MKRLDQHSKQSRLINSSISVIEGGVLGAFGIGLPDIPLFLALVLKSVYEIALSYGNLFNLLKIVILFDRRQFLVNYS
ncbi:EcsC family protein [Lacrimispora saccharolytica]|uniref:EcsC family protein n=1 Tax=Lacrimispora saccharolytica TaxID=84030 RepID=UPI0005A19343|nr:EcsC family protein [Lacrimispora saccharolytica]QRV21485.1 EcsC family protein [Lacrimispora saccharolytica]